MHQPPLIGVHGVQLDRLPGREDLSGDFADGVKETPGFVLAEVFHIQPDAGCIREFLSEKFVYQMLEILETLTLEAAARVNTVVACPACGRVVERKAVLDL